jgi:hypothetical protein
MLMYLDRDRFAKIEDDITVIQRQLNHLFATTKQTQQQDPPASLARIHDQSAGAHETTKSTTHHSDSHMPPKRTNPQFIGPTSSTFGFNIANSTLNSMGLQGDLADGDGPANDSALPTRCNTPESPCSCSRPLDLLCSIPISKVLWLLQVYKDEVAAVYPFIDMSEYIGKAHLLYGSLRDAPNQNPPDNCNKLSAVDNKDVRLVNMMVATALVLEGLGQSTLGQQLVDSVACTIGRSAREADIDFKELQILTILVRCLVSVHPIPLVEDGAKTVRVCFTSIATRRFWLGGLSASPLGWLWKWACIGKRACSRVPRILSVEID